MAGTATLLGNNNVNNNDGNSSGSSNAVYFGVASGGIRSGSYVTNTQEVRGNTKLYNAGTLSLLTANVNSNTNSVAATIESRKNAATVNETLSITATTTGIFQDATHSDSTAANDLVNVRAFNGSSFPTFLIAITSQHFVPTSGSVSVWRGDPNGSSVAASTTDFFQLIGGDSNSPGWFFTTEDVRLKTEVRAATTASDLRSFVISNTSTNAVTVVTRKSGADGALTVSLTAATTGAFEDSTHTDSLATTDTYCGKWTTGAGTSNTAACNTEVTMVNAGSKYDVLGGNTYGSNGLSTSVDSFLTLLGCLKVGPITTESQAQLEYPHACSVTRMRFFVQASTSITGTMTATFRNGGVDKGQSVALTNNTTGLFEDTTHTDNVAANDLVNTKITHPTAGTETISRVGLTADSVVTSTETGPALMSFAGIAFAASGTRAGVATGGMAFAGISMGGAGHRDEAGTGSMAFGGIGFGGVGAVRNVGVGAMHFGGISIAAFGGNMNKAASTKIAARDSVAKQALQPLTWNQPISDPKSGFPTPEFQRKWLRQFTIIEAQQKINVAITPKTYIDAQITAALGTAQTYANVAAAAAQAAAIATADAHTDAMVIPGIQLVSDLPVAPTVNTRAVVSDATSATFGDALVGGGGNTVPVVYIGSWKVG